jgi:hypothetical protein
MKINSSDNCHLAQHTWQGMRDVMRERVTTIAVCTLQRDAYGKARAM